MIYFTSDTHFRHENVIGYCRRPFLTAEDRPDLEAMHLALVQRWNQRVKLDDLVYHLGDFGFGPIPELKHWRQQLNGRIKLVLGNHDRSATAMRSAGFDEVLQWAYLNDMGPETVFLRHKPRLDWPADTGFHLCGHVHEKWRRRGNIINVGVDQWDFTPRTLAELLEAKDG